MIKPKTAWTSMELHGWPGSGNHETKKYGAYVFSKALIWNVHSRSVRAGQPASCCLLFAVWFVVFCVTTNKPNSNNTKHHSCSCCVGSLALFLLQVLFSKFFCVRQGELGAPTASKSRPSAQEERRCGFQRSKFCKPRKCTR